MIAVKRKDLSKVILILVATFYWLCWGFGLMFQSGEMVFAAVVLPVTDQTTTYKAHDDGDLHASP